MMKTHDLVVMPFQTPRCISQKPFKSKDSGPPSTTTLYLYSHFFPAAVTRVLNTGLRISIPCL